MYMLANQFSILIVFSHDQWVFKHLTASFHASVRKQNIPQIEGSEKFEDSYITHATDNILYI